MPKNNFKPVLYWVDVNPLYDDKLFFTALEYVNDARKEKISKLKFRKDKNLSLGAGLLLEYALKEFGKGAKSEIITGENGKPYLKDNSLYFSLSHSKNYALCGVAPFEIGCDIEFRENINLDIARRFFTKEEYEDIVSGEDSTDKFYRYWTLKESLMKATGLGMKLPLDRFTVYLDNPPYVKSEAIKENYYFKEFRGLSDFACAVCGSEDCSETKCVLISDIKKTVVDAL
ncbi:MAG: 4'-phosphopantetheinyl transferase superfamily protein [Clostridiales bacterium]|nr:4'-phosphopantetheinyl transferase superfamily protein [Candidatus Equinaster intestinalis]